MTSPWLANGIDALARDMLFFRYAKHRLSETQRLLDR